MVRPHRDHVLLRAAAHEVVLGEMFLAQHAPRLPDVQLMGQVPGVGELVGGQPPPSQLGPHALGHLRIMGQEVQQILGVVQVAQPDTLALGGTGVRVGPRGPVEHAERERPQRVAVALAVGQVRLQPDEPPGAGLDALLPPVPEQPPPELPVFLVVTGPPLERDAIGRGGHADAVAVRHDAAVTLPHLGHRPVGDLREEGAVRAERGDPRREAVHAGHDLAPPGEGLPVQPPVLPPDAIADAGGGQQIALVARVHEDAPAEVSLAGGGGEDAVAAGDHRAQRRVERDLHPGPLQPRQEDLLGDVRLGPCVVAGRDAVRVRDGLAELRRHPAEHPRVADVGVAEPPGGHAAHVPPRFEQHGVEAEPGGGDGGAHARGRGAVHHDLGLPHRRHHLATSSRSAPVISSRELSMRSA
nr:hypothetical protein [Nonomuraea polychroma]